MEDVDPASVGGMDARSRRRQPPLDLAWMRRGAGLRPVRSSTIEQRNAVHAAETEVMPHLTPRPNTPLMLGTQTFGEFCEIEMARINARLEHIVADCETARAQSSVYSTEGNTALALHCDARAKMLVLEEGLLKRALERWERVKNDGHFAPRLQ